MVDVPLIHIEKSVARVGETLLMAIFGTFVAKQQAKAKHIEQQADLERRSQRNAARRQEAMKDANHRRELAAQEQIEKLNELLVQSFRERVMSLDSRNILDVVGAAVRHAEAFEDEQPRQLNEDWILRFFDYASDVDDEVLRDLLGRALAEAGSESRPIVSRHAIDRIRILDSEVRASFDYMIRQLGIFGRMPEAAISTSWRGLPQDFNAPLLFELGLIKLTRSRELSRYVGGFQIQIAIAPQYAMHFQVGEFTRVGREIAGIMHPILRQRFLMSGRDGPAGKIFEAQRMLEMNDADLERYANSVIQDMTDIFGASLHMTYSHPEQSGSLQTEDWTRNTLHDPIGLVVPEWAEAHCDSESLAHFRSFVRWFEHFDKVQLPSLIPNLEPYDAPHMNVQTPPEGAAGEPNPH